MIRRKKSFFLVMALVVLLGTFGCNSISSHAANTYDANAALSYASANWNSGVGLCASFVSECLKRGGCSAYSSSCTVLRSQLINSGMGTEYEIVLESDGSIDMNKYGSIISPGDPVFYYCSKRCTSRPYIHAVLCNGSINGKMKAYSHHAANSGTYAYTHSKYCYDCDRKTVNTAYVYHFNTKHDPIGNVERITGESGAVRVIGWALDEDVANQALELHVYIGGIVGTANAEGHSIKADKYREDVNAAYGKGAYHGFHSVISTSKRGYQPVYIYAINDDGTNPMIGSGTAIISEPFNLVYDSSDVKVEKGEEGQLGLSFSGNGISKMIVELADDSIADASFISTDWSNGRSTISVIGKKAGTTALTVKMLNENGQTLYSRSTQVIVSETVTPVTIELNKYNVDIKENEKGQLGVRFSGDGISSMELRMSDESIAEASITQTDWNNGTGEIEITGKKAGDAILTVTLLGENRETLRETNAKINVEREAKIYTLIFDLNTVSVNKNEEVKTGFVFSGDGISSMAISVRDTSIAEAAFISTDWNTCRSEMNIIGKNPGTTYLKVEMLSEEKKIIFSKELEVTVLEIEEMQEDNEVVEKLPGNSEEEKGDDVNESIDEEKTEEEVPQEVLSYVDRLIEYGKKLKLSVTQLRDYVTNLLKKRGWGKYSEQIF